MCDRVISSKALPEKAELPKRVSLSGRVIFFNCDCEKACSRISLSPCGSSI